MDMKKIGLFLAELRREKGLTQEQLGEQLSVTNKTISRWENGNYMPPVEMLQELSKLYGVSINELVSGQRLADENYRQSAEQNIRSALKTSSFTIDEQIAFYKRKWRKDHLSYTIFFCLLLVGLLIWGYNRISQTVNVIAPLLTTGFCVIRHNLMMAYVERNVFDTPEFLSRSQCDEEAASRHKKGTLRRLRLAALIFLGITVLITADLGCNLIYSLIPELNDGITIRTPLAYLVFSDHWSRARFYEGFRISLIITLITGAWNIALTFMAYKREI